MSRVLIPLDGSHLAEGILPDACDMAGPGGELVLLHVIPTQTQNRGTDGFTGRTPLEGSEVYLQTQAAPLRAKGFKVEKHTEFCANVSAAIDEAAVEYEIDVIACATHGRSPVDRLGHGGVAWRAIANSHVPVLVRHIDESGSVGDGTPTSAHIMVPLDGSVYAEKALPIAERLAMQLNGNLSLIHVLPTALPGAIRVPGETFDLTQRIAESEQYLASMKEVLARETEVDTLVTTGEVVDKLCDFVTDAKVTHVVMASHGRTALSRVILGSVADRLIHALRLPIVVIPALAPGRIEDHDAGSPRPKVQPEPILGSART